MRASPVPVATLVQEGRVRELRGIGAGIEARLRELVESGEIAEVTELRRSTPLELAAFGRLLGFGAERAVAIGAALGISTVPELREAAQAGRLREVPGIGPKTEAKIAAALEREGPARPRGLLLPRARALTQQIADALGPLPIASDEERVYERLGLPYPPPEVGTDSSSASLDSSSSRARSAATCTRSRCTAASVRHVQS